MELVDTHCHIQSAGLPSGERTTRELWAKAHELSGDQLVINAQQAGVTKLICVGCDVEDSQLAIRFAEQHADCFASVGIHPHEAARVGQALRQQFAALVTTQKVVAVGECGLDYFYEHSLREAQIEMLQFQLDLAVQHNLPVIFHVREAFDDFWPIFDSYQGKLRGVLHSFTDSAANLERATERGLYVGVNGIATFTKQPAQLDVYKAIPDDRLLLETDAPFLTPVPFRGKINEPKQIATVLAFLAELRNQDITVLGQITQQNSLQLFDI